MACDLGPYEIEDVVCLLKNLLAVELNNTEEIDEGDDWKK